ncbi:tetratricopeptide repeat protein [Kordiimonas aquimaris]|uniref:tetratricopeptide repeat protein n=1 Tax=Kordiimonas aquimaris TaxID=707591 RepID=UPI0021CE8124|nr:hypothetical protein [Kordiimonas aquimaris]
MLSLILGLLIVSTPLDCSQSHAAKSIIQKTYYSGQLAQAIDQAESILACKNTNVDQKVELHLQLAAINDRIGLHQNTRPVAASLDHINKAALLSSMANEHSQAAVLLARAKYFYRAEMVERKFPQAERYGEQALAVYTALDNVYGQADATHALGLVFFQRRELEKARIYFDRSLELENRSGNARAVMLADYGRHVGFIHLISEQVGAAVPFFEQSLMHRRTGGLTDAAMFAAITLASAYADQGNIPSAKETVAFALDVAEEINSPNGLVRVLFVEAKISEVEGNKEAAMKAYGRARKTAMSIDLAGSVARAEEAIKRLSDN